MNILQQLTSSQVRTTLLQFFTQNENEDLQFGEIQKKLNVNPRQLTLQLQNLKEIDFVKERILGNKKFYQANKNIFYFKALKHFVEVLNKHDDWFRWERAATVHHLYQVVQAGMKPMKDYFGICWPLTIMIYTGENVLWCNKVSEMSSRGQTLIDWYKVKSNKIQYEKDLSTVIEDLKKVLQKVEKMNLQKLDKKKLFNLYNELKDTYIRWYSLFWATELVAVRCEEILKAQLKDLSPDEFSILTAVSEKSFSQEIEDDMNLLVELAEKFGFKNKKFCKFLKNFQRNYFWMHDNYYETKVLQEEEIILDIKKRLERTKSEFTPSIDLQKEKAKLIKKYKINSDTQQIIEISDKFTFLQDLRKKWIMIYAHFLEQILAEIGNRAQILLHDMRYTMPMEIEDILKAKKFDFEARQENCMIVFQSGALEGEFYLGQRAKSEENKYFHANVDDTAVAILKGNVACNGKAIGPVKILMNPNEIYKVNHGDVLVTSMTSPDFMPAMRKCVAIITNEGGLTCHAAVIARELNIPCIIGTKVATKVLKDGDKVEVDGDRGEVRKV